MALKVSVVVPAYRSGRGIDRVVASIERQTLPADQFEVIIVDDGSPDKTFAHLEKIRDSHLNIRIARIENSGWSSRPRNVGLEMARGEYVLFMDHDDELYPNALLAGYGFASACGADILNGKESRTGGPGWAVDSYVRNESNVVDRHEPQPLAPMNPHKLYRREFLLAHGIRFPERRRALYEDNFFNMQSLKHARVISTLAEVPFYHWVKSNRGSTSSTFRRDPEEFWSAILSLVEFADTQLSDARNRLHRQQMIVYQYRLRVLGYFNEKFSSRSELEIEIALRYMHQILKYVPRSYDRLVGRNLQAKAALLRSGQMELIRDLSSLDAQTVGTSKTRRVYWAGDNLVIEAESSWRTGKEPLRFDERGGRILRSLPQHIQEALPAEVLDVTDDVAATTTVVTVSSRSDYVTWALPSECEVRIERSEAGSAEVFVRTRTTMNIEAAAFGEPLRDAVWDFQARNTMLGTTNHRPLRTDLKPLCALINGRAAVVYRHVDGALSLDLQQDQRSTVAEGSPAFDRATFQRLGWGRVRFTLPLDGVHVVGETRLTGELGLWPLGHRTAHILSSHRVAQMPLIGRRVARLLRGTAAVLVGNGQGAILHGEFRAVPGRYLLTCRFGPRTVVTRIRVWVSPSGRISFGQRPVRA